MIELKGRVYGVLSARNEAADRTACEFRTGSVYDNPLHKAIKCHFLGKMIASARSNYIEREILKIVNSHRV